MFSKAASSARATACASTRSSDARTDEHLWAESFDETLTAENVFAIQSRIARSIAQALRARLTAADEATLAEAPTTVIEALDHYHRGKALWNSRSYVEPALECARMFERAVELDPEFAEAWAALALARSWLVRMEQLHDTLPARQALERAIALAPRAAETELARGYYAYYARGDFAGARAHLDAAERLWPGDVRITQALGQVLRRLGQWEESLALQLRAAEMDPRNAYDLSDAGFSLIFLRRFAEAEHMLDRAIVLAPENPQAHHRRVHLFLHGLGDTLRARRALEAAERADVEPTRLATMAAELSLFRRDYAAMLDDVRMARLAGARQYLLTTSLPGEIAALLAHHLAGDHDAVRAAADTVRARAEQELRGLGQADLGDAFGRRASRHVHLALVEALLGRRDAAAREAEHALSLYNERHDAADGAMIREYASIAFALAGHHDRAVTELERLASIPSYTNPAGLRINPLYDPLRQHPRFRALVGEAGRP